MKTVAILMLGLFAGAFTLGVYANFDTATQPSPISLCVDGHCRPGN